MNDISCSIIKKLNEGLDDGDIRANDLNGKHISLYELFMFIVGRYTNDEILKLSKDLKEYVDEDV